MQEKSRFSALRPIPSENGDPFILLDNFTSKHSLATLPSQNFARYACRYCSCRGDRAALHLNVVSVGFASVLQLLCVEGVSNGGGGALMLLSGGGRGAYESGGENQGLKPASCTYVLSCE